MNNTTHRRHAGAAPPLTAADAKRLDAAAQRAQEEFMAGQPPALQLPRAEWARHPAFRSQTLLLRSHDGFRALGRGLVAELRRLRLPERTAVASVAARYRRWMRNMGSHEHYEESKLYPFLARKHGVSFEHLQADHAFLHVLEAVVLETLADAEVWKPTDERDGRAVLFEAAAAMAAYVDYLHRHLEREEEVVVPMLLSMTRDEFTTYYQGDVGDLLAMLDRNETRLPPGKLRRTRMNCCDVPPGSISCCR